MEKTYFTCNYKGDVGVHDADKMTAELDLKNNQEKYPDEEWEMFEQKGDE